MAYSIGLGFMIVLTYAFFAWAKLNAYGIEFALFVAATAGIGSLVARADQDRPFLKAAAVSLVTTLCIQSVLYIQMTTAPATEQPWVLPPPGVVVVVMIGSSLMVAGMAGAVAAVVRSLRDRA
jgi:hypothetical protein